MSRSLFTKKNATASDTAASHPSRIRIPAREVTWVSGNRHQNIIRIILLGSSTGIPALYPPVFLELEILPFIVAFLPPADTDLNLDLPVLEIHLQSTKVRPFPGTFP